MNDRQKEEEQEQEKEKEKQLIKDAEDEVEEKFELDDNFRTKIYSLEYLSEIKKDDSSYDHSIDLYTKHNRKSGRRRLKKQKKKSKKKKVIRRIATAFLVLLLISSAIYIAKWAYDNYSIKKLDEENKSVIEKSTHKNNDNKKLDLAEIKKANDQSVFLLEFKLFNINKIVVKANNNEFYLKHDFKKQYNFAGWLFLDHRNSTTDEEKNYVVYGHNMRDGKTMFSPLPKLMNKSFLKRLTDDEKIITIRNENGESKYKIFSVHQIKDNDIGKIKLLVSDDEELKKTVDIAKRMSIYDFGVDIRNAKQMITLITCGTTNEDRILVHAIKINN